MNSNEPARDALLDFLYSDHERVASFLSQLAGSGALKASEAMGTKIKTHKQKGAFAAGLISAGLEGDRSWKQEIKETYDPLWVNSRKLIDEIYERQSSVRKESIDIGKILILSGTLLCFDYTILNALMSADAFEDLIATSVNDSDAGGKSKNGFREKKKLASVLRGLLQSLPLGMGFVLVTEHGHFWFSVKREYLNLHDLDIPLKFPLHISGKWEVLGIVDALPNDHVEGIQSVINKQIDGLMPPMVFNLMEMIGTITGQFGRPLQAGGISPLIVYRDVFADSNVTISDS